MNPDPSIDPASASEDTLFQGLERASVFMEEVRAVQYASGKKLRGSIVLDNSIMHSVQTASNASNLIAALKAAEIITDKEATTLFERFEEMCRRRHVTVSDNLRPFIVKMLAAELAANSLVLGLEHKDVLSVTVYQGNIASLLKEEEFALFADTPGIIKHAALHNPSDPRTFLRKVIKDIEAITAEKEFALFADTPGIIKRAAINYPSDPRTFLRKVIKDIEAITAEEEFALFADTPNIIRQAAVGYPSDPRTFLRKVIKDIEAITAEEEFALFADTPNIIKYAAVNYPSDPCKFLRELKKSLATLNTQPGFKKLSLTQQIRRAMKEMGVEENEVSAVEQLDKQGVTGERAL